MPAVISAVLLGGSALPLEGWTGWLVSCFDAGTAFCVDRRDASIMDGGERRARGVARRLAFRCAPFPLSLINRR